MLTNYPNLRSIRKIFSVNNYTSFDDILFSSYKTNPQSTTCFINQSTLDVPIYLLCVFLFQIRITECSL